MRTGVFISYRRSDSAGNSGRLSDHVKRAFPSSEIFIDVDGLEPGIDFANELKKRIDASRVMLLMIGPNWNEPTGDDSKSRLHDPDDFVRFEIEQALQQDVTIVPVLVDDAVLPDRDDLPESIQKITEFNAVALRHARFKDDATVIENFLSQLLKPPIWKRPLTWIGSSVAAAIILVVVLILMPEPITKLKATPDTDGTIAAAVTKYLRPEYSNSFLVLTVKSRKEYLQFTNLAGDESSVLFDLPKKALNAEQLERAESYFARAGQREGVEYRTDVFKEPTFNLIVPREKSMILTIVREVFQEVYGFEQLPAVRARIGS